MSYENIFQNENLLRIARENKQFVPLLGIGIPNDGESYRPCGECKFLIPYRYCNIREAYKSAVCFTTNDKSIVIFF